MPPPGGPTLPKEVDKAVWLQMVGVWLKSAESLNDGASKRKRKPIQTETLRPSLAPPLMPPDKELRRTVCRSASNRGSTYFPGVSSPGAAEAA